MRWDTSCCIAKVVGMRCIGHECFATVWRSAIAARYALPFYMSYAVNRDAETDLMNVSRSIHVWKKSSIACSLRCSKPASHCSKPANAQPVISNADMSRG